MGAKIMRLRGICKKMREKVGGSGKNDYLCGVFFDFGKRKPRFWETSKRFLAEKSLM